MRTRNSFWGILRREVSEEPAVVVERVRKAMLLALDQYGDLDSDLAQVRVEMCIRFATSLDELWYLRPDLQQALALHLEYTRAQAVLQDITQLFEGRKHP